MNDLDVFIVGTGPGGFIAARKCAEAGLKTLLLEKLRLPLEKIIPSRAKAMITLLKKTNGGN